MCYLGRIVIVLSVVTDVPASAEAPLPPTRPPDLTQERAGAPSPAPQRQETDPAGPSAPSHSDDGRACAEMLTRLGVKAEPAGSIQDGACGARSTLKVAELPGGVEVAPAALVTCPVAAAMARWASESVTPEAERHLGSAPAKILIGTSYECRSQNRRAGAKLSEHAFANAVDVMGFTFRKRGPLAVAPRSDEGPESLFQAAVRQGACSHFTTVLGPGSDAAHSNHFHLDMRERKRSAKLCQ